ncbi:hypothetical protein IBT47_01090 [Erwinia sp. S43]|uniref:Uncharacterized protein n=1 Tax=Pantoea coffeiphila TaxID=1465635 RepID=A0A2S9I431_9GAMM|nr:MULTISPECIES: hypothetical protein [Erwiniaceae]MBK0030867.1 hypothetical protein [Erwinia sp. S43]MCW1876398.1 hypothetical protein [Erwinia sp. INIA01]PRD12535.1 hypothetical protein CQW29_25905 [Pantoea coffeiphila]
MSYYIKPNRGERLAPLDDEKTVFQALVCAELEMCSGNAQERIVQYKASLAKAAKQSSASLLRQKLKGCLVRERQEM